MKASSQLFYILIYTIHSTSENAQKRHFPVHAQKRIELEPTQRNTSRCFLTLWNFFAHNFYFYTIFLANSENKHIFIILQLFCHKNCCKNYKSFSKKPDCYTVKWKTLENFPSNSKALSRSLHSWVAEIHYCYILITVA